MSADVAGISVGIVDGDERTFVAITISSGVKVRQLLLNPDRAVALLNQLAVILGGLGLMEDDEDGEAEECLVH